jgi:Na+-translocating ferredoxin:NAD+ oxidoreductase RNF subunit RnfB
MPILIPILVLAAIAILCAVLLTVSNVFFGVPEDERFTAVREELPGANCGACGFSGCDGYAKALSEGRTTKTNLCTAGGDGVAKRVAAVMGVEAESVVEMVAHVACNGSCQPDEKKYEYVGPKTCVAANMSYSGDRDCTFACLGYGDCVKVCPRDAICINPEKGIAEIDPRKCIGCGLCAKNCPASAITRTDYVAPGHKLASFSIDTAKCVKCGACMPACKFKAISKG